MLLKKKISLLIPAYNEEEVLLLLYHRLIKLVDSFPNYDWEILFINDGSIDNTISILRDLSQQDDSVKYIDFSRNFGKEIAMMAGFDYVSGDAVIILDADLQHPPEVIPEMLKYWEEGYDDVAAKRKSVDGETYLKKATSRLFYRILSKLARLPIQQDTGDFRLLDRKCIESIKQLRETQRYTKGFYGWIGFNKKIILFDQSPRLAGKTKWNYFQLINLAIEGITSFTVTPLRISTLLGLIISFFSFFYGSIIIIKSYFYGDPVRGYPTLIVAILFLGGIQLLSIGILGEYIGRIFNESKNRPPYLIKEKSFK